MSFEVAIKVENLGKSYRFYNRPLDRLKQMILPKLKKITDDELKQYYQEFWALNNISFEIKKGEIVGIIGRNGSGKSTLLQLICGTTSPTTGWVETSGRIAALLELGAGFNPEFTGRENVYMNAALLGMSTEEVSERFLDIAAFADIGEFIEQPVKSYSSGMFVRLAFAVQAYAMPNILVIDEALAVGDIFFQQKCIKHIQSNLPECTKVLVTHDMRPVQTLCTRVIVLQDGHLLFDGGTREGIEVFMRSSHNDIFSKNNSGVKDNSNEIRGCIVTNKEERSNGGARKSLEQQTVKWHAIPKGNIGGRRGCWLEKFSISVNDKLSFGNQETVFSGDKVEVTFNVLSSEELDEIIFGYLIVDKNGLYVCGDNSLSLGYSCSIDAKGEKTFRLSFFWPAIADGPYTLTLGIGRGTESMNHTIECWAHSICAFHSISRDPVHGLFANPMESLVLLETYHDV